MTNKQEKRFSPSKSWKRLRDLLLEVLVVLVVVIGGIIYVALHPKANQHWEMIALAVNTAIVFGFLISWFRDEWKHVVFWATFAALLLAHTTTYLFVLRRIGELPLVYYFLLNPVELAIFAPILRKLLVGHTDRR